MFSAAITLGAHSLEHYRPLAVAADLRGFAAEASQLRISVADEEAVSITGCVARKCPTGRDLYFERRYKLDSPSWERSVIGKTVDSLLGGLHAAGLQFLEDAFEAATTNKKPVNLAELGTRIREKGEELARTRLLEEWEYRGHDKSLKDMSIEQFAAHIAGTGGPDLIEKTLEALFDLVRHETEILIAYVRRRRRSGRIRDFLLRQPGRWMAEVRAVLARLQAEVKLDDPKQTPAIALGLSNNIKPDVLYAVTLVGDVKSGEFHDYYASVATGYAIFVEYALKTRVNTAVIVAVDLDLKSGKLRSLQVVPIQPDDERRRRWLAQRNGAIEVLRATTPPQHPTDEQECEGCHFRDRCWLNGIVGTTPITPSAPQKAPVSQKKAAQAPGGKGKQNAGAKAKRESDVPTPPIEQAADAVTSAPTAEDLKPDALITKPPDAI